MRFEKLYLMDIVEAAEAVQRFVVNVKYDDFLHDELRQSAILQKLIIIGEAVAHLSQVFRDQHHEIEWKNIVGFRNIAVHQYFSVEMAIVWITATEDVPTLRCKVVQILEQEYLQR